MPLDVRNSDSVIIFKRKLNIDIKAIHRHFYAGNRRAQVLHTRLRTKCSSLNDDLFQKRITDSPLCLCGNLENTDHYFMHCPLYGEQRAELNQKIIHQLLFKFSYLEIPYCLCPQMHSFLKQSINISLIRSVSNTDL